MPSIVTIIWEIILRLLFGVKCPVCHDRRRNLIVHMNYQHWELS